jgi:hypothetical protein
MKQAPLLYMPEKLTVGWLFEALDGRASLFMRVLRMTLG